MIMENNNKTVLAIVAHPDDAEFTCAGTLALFKQKGWHIEMATMTAGDCGSAEHSREEISEIRKKEAASAAEIIDGNYHCLEADDIFLMYDRPTLLKTIALIRKTRPKIVLTMSPSCYMVDHETTSLLAQTACFSAGIINIKTEDIPPYYFTPYLYYVDPMEGKDKFGNQVKATTIVDISEVMDIKEKMLKSHKSQQSWLMSHNGMDEYTLTMKELSEKRGAEISTKYGEGFRQHLGHAFPQDNIIKQELGELVVASNKNEYVS
jgi:LmbE family N-acetylglucosaminyl deacetylase